jgi:hypothetical protein
VSQTADGRRTIREGPTDSSPFTFGGGGTQAGVLAVRRRARDTFGGATPYSVTTVVPSR